MSVDEDACAPGATTKHVIRFLDTSLILLASEDILDRSDLSDMDTIACTLDGKCCEEGKI